MTDVRNQRDFRRRLRQMGVVGRAWSLALVGVFLLAAPLARTGELHEIGSAKERVEEVSLMARSVSLMRTALHSRREAIVFTSSIQARLGRDQQLHEAAAPPGHRLPNGLLAPMTC
jgi:hypothetical protein